MKKKKIDEKETNHICNTGLHNKMKVCSPYHTSNTKHIEVIQFIIECDNYLKEYTYIYVNTQESEQLEPVNAWMDSWVIKMFADSVFWLRD